MSIDSPKREARDEVIVAYVVPVTLSHPMHSSCTSSLFYV
jgi:hypothetical protein